MEKFNQKELAWKIYNALNDKGAELGNASVFIINKVLNEEFQGEDSFELPDCTWGKTHAVTTVSQHLECASSKDYTNGRHTNCPQELDVAIKHYSKKFDGDPEYAEYWDNQSKVLTKVTTIREVVAIIRPEDKK